MTVTAAIDPFTRGVDGVYSDGVVRVSRTPVGPDGAALVRTRHFALGIQDGQLQLWHWLPAARIDNDLAGLLAEELFAPGWASGADTFERMLTGVVLSSAPDPVEAWLGFYRNTLRRLDEPGTGGASGSLSDYAPVYAHARALLAGRSVLELACCFGFFSLRLGRAFEVTASDRSAGTVALLRRVAPALDRPLRTLVCDAARVPEAPASFDSVVALHLLEHLDEADGAAVVAEAMRLARRRVIVAVPYEDQPTPAFGHVRALRPEDLRTLGRLSGWPFELHESHGGWLVLDRPA